jgi:hypothetical protein
VRGQYLVTWKQVSNPALLIAVVNGILVTPAGSLAGGQINFRGLVADPPRVVTGCLGDFMAVYDDFPLTVDTGVYGHLAGNRAYIPQARK